MPNRPGQLNSVTLVKLVKLPFSILFLYLQIHLDFDNQDMSAFFGNAEIAIKPDLPRNYMNSKECMVLSKCRTSSLSELGELLLEPTTLWKGLSRHDFDYEGRLAYNNVLRSPSRGWGSSIWDAELARGAFNNMSAERRKMIDGIFTLSKVAQTFQLSILDNQASLKVLANTIELPQSDRLRYFDMVSTIDQRSIFIELFSNQLAKSIEELGLNFKKDERENYRESLADLIGVLMLFMVIAASLWLFLFCLSLMRWSNIFFV